MSISEFVVTKLFTPKSQKPSLQMCYLKKENIPIINVLLLGIGFSGKTSYVTQVIKTI